MPFRVSPAKQQELINKGEYLVTTVDHDTISAIIAWILNNLPEKKIFTLLINSSGGSPVEIIYFASFMSTIDPEVKIRGIAFEECGSAAFALLQCCHERVAVKHCGFFIHHVHSKLSVDCHGYDMKKIEAEILQSQIIEKELAEIQSNRCGMSYEDWMKLADKGEEIQACCIFPSDALRLNLIDKIVEDHLIF